MLFVLDLGLVFFTLDASAPAASVFQRLAASGFRADGEHRQQALQVAALTFGAGRRLVMSNQRLKAMTAATTFVLVKWHLFLPFALCPLLFALFATWACSRECPPPSSSRPSRSGTGISRQRSGSSAQSDC